jgi:hypothetical protein
MCFACWYKSRQGRDPARINSGKINYCCFCGIPTRSGIWVRGDPAHTPCKGAHPYNPAKEEVTN